MNILQTPIQYVKGIGPSKAKRLLGLELRTVEDILYYFPRRYEDRSHFKTIKELSPGGNCTIKGTVNSIGSRRAYHRRGFYICEAIVEDDTGSVVAVWFNQPYIKELFKKGDELILYGKVDLYKGGLQIVSPEYELLSKEEEQAYLHIGRIVPVYTLTERLSQRFLRAAVYDALNSYSYRIVDILPRQLRIKKELINLPDALRAIHFPDGELQLNEAKKRLAFDELFLFNIGLALRRHLVKVETRGIQHKIDGKLISSFRASLPFQMTQAQNNAVREILQDMAGSSPMQRCLCGEVGSGKTVVAVFACLVAIEGGYQVAFMVPTEILAEQHHDTLTKLLSSLGIEVACLTGSSDNEKKALLKYRISKDDIKIVIGTHTLIQKNIQFKNLGLVIIDEQHKFGVLQRSMLKSKGANPDFLVMSATPIPRTLALTLYGDLDITLINELPKGRGRVETVVLDEKSRRLGWNYIERELKEGRQAYIVYPLVNESSRLELRAATQMYKKLKQDIFKDFKIGLIHGQMESYLRNKTMDDFKDGKLDILVSTSVVEVGVDIGNATVILIEHAERFGLAQLHQLRGRIARSFYPSYCILISDSKDELCLERLNFLTQTTEGVKIAEKDLILRGSGDFFGTKQSGMPEFKMANPGADLKLLEDTRKTAFELIDKDPALSQVENKWLKMRLRERFKGIKLDMVSA